MEDVSCGLGAACDSCIALQETPSPLDTDGGGGDQLWGSEEEAWGFRDCWGAPSRCTEAAESSDFERRAVAAGIGALLLQLPSNLICDANLLTSAPSPLNARGVALGPLPPSRVEVAAATQGDAAGERCQQQQRPSATYTSRSSTSTCCCAIDTEMLRHCRGEAVEDALRLESGGLLHRERTPEAAPMLPPQSVVARQLSRLSQDSPAGVADVAATGGPQECSKDSSPASAAPSPKLAAATPVAGGGPFVCNVDVPVCLPQFEDSEDCLSLLNLTENQWQQFRAQGMFKLGDKGRAIIKSRISRQLRVFPHLRKRASSVAGVRCATTKQLFQLAQPRLRPAGLEPYVSGLLPAAHVLDIGSSMQQLSSRTCIRLQWLARAPSDSKDRPSTCSHVLGDDGEKHQQPEGLTRSGGRRLEEERWRGC
ncbi:at hook motif-containing protein [Cyclospora cayetanensis]|uniref:At hook motif-containing protein n=1 Tax=Cyclospora cayetanensis TaxID=88456 RepID=A0A1D3DB07_9EIME|nr:at hook motif-containing protein [Cyclospora cayetanensis]